MAIICIKNNKAKRLLCFIMAITVMFTYVLSDGGGYNKAYALGSYTVNIACSLGNYITSIPASGRMSVQVVSESSYSGSFTWKSSNTSVISVASDGTFKALKNGTATITATSIDGVYSGTYTITVNTNKTKYGDYDGDGIITSADVAQLISYVTGNHTPSNTDFELGDLDCDGELTRDDVTLISEYTVGNITTFPVESLIKSISISSLPHMVQYSIDESVSTSGLGLSVVYNNNQTKTVYSGFDIEYDTDSAGLSSVTVNYSDDTVTRECSYKIYVSKREAVIKGTTLYQKNVGDEFSIDASVYKGDEFIEYEIIEGDSIEVSTDGEVECINSGTTVLLAYTEESREYKRAELTIRIVVDSAIPVVTTEAITTENNLYDYYVVEYNANGGILNKKIEMAENSKDITITDIIPTRTGYNFLGWGLTPDATYVSYMPGDIYSDRESTVLYALWETGTTTTEMLTTESSTTRASSTTESSNNTTHKLNQTITVDGDIIVTCGSSKKISSSVHGDGKLSFSVVSAYKDIISVDSNGKIKSKKIGIALVKLTLSETDKYYKEMTTVKVIVIPKKVTISKVKSPGKRKIYVSIKKLNDVTGYEYNITGKGLSASPKSAKTTIKGKGKSKVTYKIKVRAYKKVGDEVLYGAWSKVKKVKVK